MNRSMRCGEFAWSLSGAVDSGLVA